MIKNTRMKTLILFTTLFTFAFVSSCNKIAGEGGTSKITGKVWIVDLNASGDTIAQYAGMDEDVYIIYGEGTNTYSDKFSSSFDGTYEFSHLTPGKYTVFAYSKCSTCPSEQNVIKKTIEIKAKNEAISVEDLIIIQ